MDCSTGGRRPDSHGSRHGSLAAGTSEGHIMTQHPHTPSGTSFDDPEATTLSQHPAYDDTTSVTSASPTGVSATVDPYSSTMPDAGMPQSSSGNGTTSTSVRDEAASVTSDAKQSGRQ